ncbi:hypothetical protein [Paenibacillus senegalensis]|uniref:hypothetical protein n=1 Tax=Paenibacillus senegalensis TaxID=1465766 RepID=UPI000287D341|nr:hypothetical protein [Paenibacillus senegalensis]
MSTHQTYMQWVNDQLDLYNYAKQLCDVEWQQSILARLRESAPSTFDTSCSPSATTLWKQYEEIIQQMVNLYEQARCSHNEGELEQIKERMWQLKQQRIHVAKAIQDFSVQTKKPSSQPPPWIP